MVHPHAIRRGRRGTAWWLALVVLAPALGQAAARQAAATRPAASRPAAASYAHVLQQPAAPIVADALTEEQKLALEAAKFEANANLRLLRAQRARGLVTQAQFDRQSARATTVAGVNNAAFASPIAKASLRRGADGGVLVQASSLADSVDGSIEELRKTIPSGVDPRPAEAYLASLRDRTRRSIAARADAADVLPLAQASGLVQPIQETQLMMSAGGPGWMYDLELRTEPSEAIVAFATQSGYRELFTTQTSRSVLRGEVGYAVLKTGYKKATGKLNLVSASKGVFTCKLVPVSSPDPPMPCNAP
jgi:hypothetical protein